MSRAIATTGKYAYPVSFDATSNGMLLHQSPEGDRGVEQAITVAFDFMPFDAKLMSEVSQGRSRCAEPIR